MEELINKLHKAEVNLADAWHNYRNKKIDLRMTEVQAYFSSTADTFKTVDKRTAYVDSQTEGQQRELAELRHKAQLLEADVAKLRNLLDYS